jgi:anti-sigma factor RsiW
LHYVGGSDCGDYRIGLGVYALGRLAGTEAAELRAHVARCGTCRAELAELREVADLLKRSRPSRWGPRGGPHRAVNGACAASSRPRGR